MSEALEYFRGDERPAWAPTVRVSGVYDDMTTGYTFSLRCGPTYEDAPTFIKTTGISGGLAGLVTVNWNGELDIAPGKYILILSGIRTSDTAPWSIEKTMIIKGRMPSV